MRILSLAESQNLLLEIVKDLDTFCRSNNISYWACGGTLIGSVRHGGFIPWDDDIDILMPRDDYELFVATYTSKKPFKVLSCKNTEGYYYPFAKVVNTNTRFEEDLVASGLKRIHALGVGVDIFPLDCISDEIEKRKIQIKKSDWVRRRALAAHAMANTPQSGNFMFKAAWKILMLFGNKSKPIDKYWEEQKEIFGDTKSSNTYFDSWADCVYDKEWMNPPSELKFEDAKILGPKDWDSFLTSIFGDYMTPVKALENGHGKAYLIDEENYG